MLQNAVEYLMQNSELIEKVKEGTESLVGLSEMEQKAVLEVFGGSGSSTSGSIEYW
ncbi:competence pheromone ComX [Desulfitobacterium sp.]|uniref:competence pheromone ComX n=1 Tax=Desulfitobacterium sp. TaxID=49981 RepID=UPI002B62A9AE|nr:competence pheromone ComX [Desulfitobacterium sp.]HVJ48362.1 competence pheromone ComX [Desulfitobacterium sp.]